MIIVNVDTILQVICLALMTCGLLINREIVVVFGGFILIYTLLRSIFTFDAEEECDDDVPLP